MLTVINLTAERIARAAVWECVCECGKTVRRSAHNLQAGATISCGCARVSKRPLTSAICEDCGSNYTRPIWGSKSPYCVKCRDKRALVRHQGYSRALGRSPAMRARHERLIAGGICTYCAIRPAREGRQMCGECVLSRATSRLKTKYGLNRGQVSAQLERQNYLCAICRGEMLIPHIDHHHGDGTFRGLLCGSCNRAVGLFKDNPEVMLRAAEYVRANGFHAEAA